MLSKKQKQLILHDLKRVKHQFDNCLDRDRKAWACVFVALYNTAMKLFKFDDIVELSENYRVTYDRCSTYYLKLKTVKGRM